MARLWHFLTGVASSPQEHPEKPAGSPALPNASVPLSIGRAHQDLSGFLLSSRPHSRAEDHEHKQVAAHACKCEPGEEDATHHNEQLSQSKAFLRGGDQQDTSRLLPTTPANKERHATEVHNVHQGGRRMRGQNRPSAPYPADSSAVGVHLLQPGSSEAPGRHQKLADPPGSQSPQCTFPPAAAPPAAGAQATEAHQELVPYFSSSASTVVCVPMKSPTAQSFSSVRLEAGGVMLPAACTAGWKFSYNCAKQLASINGWSGSFPCLQHAQLLPCRVLHESRAEQQRQQQQQHGEDNEEEQQEEGEGGRKVLVVCIAWPVAPPGQIGGIDTSMYRKRLTGVGAVRCHGDTSSVWFDWDTMKSIGLGQINRPFPSVVACMAAFERDGQLVPCQQPVEVVREPGESINYYMKGWKGRVTMTRQGRVVGCYRLLPKAGRSGGSGKPAGEGAASGEALAAGGAHADVKGDNEQVQQQQQQEEQRVPGLLVIQVRSVTASTPRSQGAGAGQGVREQHQHQHDSPAGAAKARHGLMCVGNGRGGGQGVPFRRPSSRSSLQIQGGECPALQGQQGNTREAGSAKRQAERQAAGGQAGQAQQMAEQVMAGRKRLRQQREEQHPAELQQLHQQHLGSRAGAAADAPGTAQPGRQPHLVASAAAMEDVAAAVAQAVPILQQQSRGMAKLQIVIPGHIVPHIRTVRVQLGDVLLPDWVTESASLRLQSPTSSHCTVTGLKSLYKAFQQGAQFHPCTAERVEGGEGWALVLHVSWPAVEAGQQGSTNMGMYRPSKVIRECRWREAQGCRFRASVLQDLGLLGSADAAESRPAAVDVLLGVQVDGRPLPYQHPATLTMESSSSKYSLSASAVQLSALFASSSNIKISCSSYLPRSGGGPAMLVLWPTAPVAQDAGVEGDAGEGGGQQQQQGGQATLEPQPSRVKKQKLDGEQLRKRPAQAHCVQPGSKQQKVAQPGKRAKRAEAEAQLQQQVSEQGGLRAPLGDAEQQMGPPAQQQGQQGDQHPGQQQAALVPAAPPAPVPGAPLPQLPVLDPAGLAGALRTRQEQVTTLLQLAKAVRGAAGLGELAMCLQDISNEGLQEIMSQYYHPIQQLQAMGGGEAAVHRATEKLLRRLVPVNAV